MDRLTKRKGFSRELDLSQELGYSYIYDRLAWFENEAESLKADLLDNDLKHIDKPITETDIQTNIRVALSDRGCVVLRMQGGKFRALKSERIVSSGNPSGVSDLICFTPSGHAIFMEVKTAKGKPSKEQVQFIKVMRGMGFVANLVRSVDEALALVEKSMG